MKLDLINIILFFFKLAIDGGTNALIKALVGRNLLFAETNIVVVTVIAIYKDKTAIATSGAGALSILLYCNYFRTYESNCQ